VASTTQRDQISKLFSTFLPLWNYVMNLGAGSLATQLAPILISC
jgi:hypothetical protein